MVSCRPNASSNWSRRRPRLDLAARLRLVHGPPGRRLGRTPRPPGEPSCGQRVVHPVQAVQGQSDAGRRSSRSGASRPPGRGRPAAPADTSAISALRLAPPTMRPSSSNDHEVGVGQLQGAVELGHLAGEDPPRAPVRAAAPSSRSGARAEEGQREGAPVVGDGGLQPRRCGRPSAARSSCPAAGRSGCPAPRPAPRPPRRDAGRTGHSARCPRSSAGAGAAAGRRPSGPSAARRPWPVLSPSTRSSRCPRRVYTSVRQPGDGGGNARTVAVTIRYPSAAGTGAARRRRSRSPDPGWIPARCSSSTRSGSAAAPTIRVSSSPPPTVSRPTTCWATSEHRACRSRRSRRPPARAHRPRRSGRPWSWPGSRRP